MRRLLFMLALALSLSSIPARADKFVNTGPGEIHTCDSTSRVGIGLTTEALPVEDRLVLGHDPGSDWEGGQIRLNMPPGTEGYAAILDNYAGGQFLRILVGTNEASIAELASWDLLSGEYRNSGDVEIGGAMSVSGDISAGGQLDVDGEVRSDVGFRAGGTALNVPDFVFEPGYKLPGLEETERFVKANRHLPGIPDAETVKKDGMDLADMNLKLLQKVEELTLHAIEQEKRINALEARLGAAPLAAVSRKATE